MKIRHILGKIIIRRELLVLSSKLSFSLNGNMIKVLACCAMLFDHIGYQARVGAGTQKTGCKERKAKSNRKKIRLSL